MSGEFDRIRAIIARLGASAAPDIGDDCAVVPNGPGTLVVSTDLSVEGTHFRTSWLSYEEIGWRCAAGALSDLAAQGASCTGVVVSVGSPASAASDAVVRLMSGVGDAVREAGGVVLGGDLSLAPQWVVDVTVLGRAERPVLRRGAREGDLIYVSGMVGGARAALRSWLRGEEPAPGARRAFAHPVPRIDLGRELARAGITSMIDLSDGLAGDVRHLARGSGRHFVIELEQLPLHPDVEAAAALAGLAAPIFAAAGGEDYELLFTCPPACAPAVEQVGKRLGQTVTRIGIVTGEMGEGVRLLLDGPQTIEGFDHFA
ncbi:MAG TPA: thiamine-phosphate kinase [Gemmatimonadales bacterium]|nr:thiamine-phosphate kinase [Gemmatimonadales bacterium]